jgi:acetyl-CoA carboxylase biotin carboxyl carrier protein
MSHEKMTYQDLLQIVEMVKASTRWSEFHLKVGDVEVDLKRTPVDGPDVSAPPPSAASGQAPAPPPAAPTAESSESVSSLHQRPGHVGGGEVVTELATAVRPAETRHRPALPAYPEDAVLIKSPMVGTFYRAPEPGAPPFVDIGQQVDVETTVCIIEVMKLMNSIPAGAGGVVTQILAADGDPVEYGQILMVIDPR